METNSNNTPKKIPEPSKRCMVLTIIECILWFFVITITVDDPLSDAFGIVLFLFAIAIIIGFIAGIIGLIDLKQGKAKLFPVICLFLV